MCLFTIHWTVKFHFPPAWALKQVFFFFLTFCCIIIPISVIIDHDCIMENFKKKSGENKNKLRTIHPKNHETF